MIQTNNQFEFFQNTRFDDNGNLMVTIGNIGNIGSNCCCNTGNTGNIGNTGNTEQEININLEQIVSGPQQIIYVVSNSVTPEHKKVNITQTVKQTTPPPRTVVIKDRELYGRVCCGPEMDSRYVDCTRCIDAYIANNPDWQIGDITNKKLGCYKRYKHK